MERNEYLEAIKQKLNALNRAAGTTIPGRDGINAIDQYNSQSDILGSLGAAGIKHAKNFTPPQESQQKESPNTGIVYL